MKLKDIWNFYMNKNEIPKSIKNIRGRGSHWKRTKKLIANKFCSCVKKLEKYGQKGIAICTKSVFNNKGLKRIGTFSCKPNKVRFIQRNRTHRRRHHRIQ